MSPPLYSRTHRRPFPPAEVRCVAGLAPVRQIAPICGYLDESRVCAKLRHVVSVKQLRRYAVRGMDPRPLLILARVMDIGKRSGCEAESVVQAPEKRETLDANGLALGVIRIPAFGGGGADIFLAARL